MLNDWAIGVAEIPGLAIKNANHVTNQRESAISMIRGALLPVATPDCALGDPRINSLLGNILCPFLPRREYGCLAGKIRRAFAYIATHILRVWIFGPATNDNSGRIPISAGGLTATANSL